ncbi:MAG: NAD(P)-dependent oxidoreductase [Gammaproteobacteria bacterium]|nr:NAD(P)-dependent oxidoreductase [Gammaproteobacteria bacterium]
MGVMRRLARERGDNSVNIGLIGAGFVGRHLTYQFSLTLGLRTAIILNRTPANAIDAYRRVGVDVSTIVVSNDVKTLANAIDAGIPAVSSSLESFAALENIEIVVEASGSAERGAVSTRFCLEAGKDVVSMNAEADATVGWLLKTIAERNGVIYTLSDGDQPGVLMRLMEFTEAAGFETVAAINCKGFIDRHATPESIRAWSKHQGTSQTMTTAFTDGTKINFENASIANATGLLPERRGMHGIQTTMASAVQDMIKTFDGRGIVDYTLGGDFGGGVIVLGYLDNPISVAPVMQYLKMGSGPYYQFFRPYHLVHIETPVSVAQVVMDRDETISPASRFVVEVVSIAKQDLKPASVLDGIGGRTLYGEIDKIENTEDLLPMGIADKAIVQRPVNIDHPIRLDDVALNEESDIVKMWRKQKSLNTYSE